MIQNNTNVKLLHVEKFEIFLNIDLRYFPDLEQTEHWQLMLFSFFEAARQSCMIVYGTSGSAIIVKMKIGKSPLFSSEAAIGTFCRYKFNDMKIKQ